jgi:5-methylcytosine-specific restriction endonuclease McrA
MLLNMENTKKCTKCGKELLLDRFNKKKSGSMGRSAECRDCAHIRAAEFRKNNPDKIKAGKVKYYQENKGEVKTKALEWHRNNPEKTREISARWYQRNKDKVRVYGAKYYEENKEAVNAYTAKWWKNNPMRNAEYKRRYRIKFPEYRILENVRSLIYQTLRNNIKSGHTEELLGCSVEELYAYLESLFQPGMTWDNWGRGGWQIDHIIPLDYFDFSDPEQQKRAWHYTNLQPLWAIDNLRKSNKIEERQLVLL